MAQLPDAVLFTCNLNKVRSPVAAALLRHRLAGQRLQAYRRVRDGLHRLIQARFPVSA